MKIAILGYGVVGSGVDEIITNLQDKCFNPLEVSRIFVRKRTANPITTDDIDEIMNDPEIDVVVECLGGLHPAYEFIKKALINQKHVVTANKAVVAKYLTEFLALAKSNKVKFLFEASIGGGIPWVHNLTRVRRIDQIQRLYGIFNGTSNYILDNMYRHHQEFGVILKQAQALGYAEADPSADIDGYDVANKIILSNFLAFDYYQYDYPVYSMRLITKDDIDFLKSKHLVTKYVAESVTKNGYLETSTMLTLFKETDIEANVTSNNNVITLEGDVIGELKFMGQGAGKLPTANAIVQDILDIKTAVKVHDNVVMNKYQNSNELTTRSYLLRCNADVKNDLIIKSEKYQNHYYLTTAKITLKELQQLVETLTHSVLVMRYFEEE